MAIDEMLSIIEQNYKRHWKHKWNYFKDGLENLLQQSKVVLEFAADKEVAFTYCTDCENVCHNPTIDGYKKCVEKYNNFCLCGIDYEPISV